MGINLELGFSKVSENTEHVMKKLKLHITNTNIHIHGGSIILCNTTRVIIKIKMLEAADRLEIRLDIHLVVEQQTQTYSWSHKGRVLVKAYSLI